MSVNGRFRYISTNVHVLGCICFLLPFIKKPIWKITFNLYVQNMNKLRGNIQSLQPKLSRIWMFASFYYIVGFLVLQQPKLNCNTASESDTISTIPIPLNYMFLIPQYHCVHYATPLNLSIRNVAPTVAITAFLFRSCENRTT